MTSLDSHALEVISRFKQAVLSKTLSRRSHSLATPNRGNKLAASSGTTFHPKVVEYDGTSHLVLSNEALERSSHRNKRKWTEVYAPEKRSRRVDDTEVEEDPENFEDDDENDSDDDGEPSESESPFGNFPLAEILAPLSHPSEIVSHAAILKTYKLNVLGRLALELIDLIEVEQTNLNWLNKLLQVLNGEDWFYLLEENLGLDSYDHGLVQEEGKEDAPAPQTASEEEQPKEEEPEEAHDEYKRITRTSNSRLAPLLDDTKVTDPFFALPEALRKYEAHQTQYSGDEPNPNDLALVQEDLVNYLQVSIQRQHEYIKNLSAIRNGIVKVDRYKQDLHKWGKEMHDKKSS